MKTFFHKHIFFISVVSFLTASILFTTQVLAVGKPAGAGQNSPQNSGQSNPSAIYSQQGNRPTYQQNLPPQAGSINPSGKPLIRERPVLSGVPQQGQEGISQMPQFAQVRLKDAKLRACQAISASITSRSTHLVDLVAQMEKTFTSIAQGVEQYYLTKVVPTGTTLSNYDALVADIITQENAIAPLVQAAQTDVTSFSCTGNNPAAQLTQYRTDMQAVLKGLQEYRTAIKNLIVAVRTLPSTTSSITPSMSPSIAPTTTATPSSVIPSVTP